MGFTRVITLNILLVSLLGYFTYHTVLGKRGVIARYSIQEEIFTLRSELVTIADKRANFEFDVSSLRPDSLDRDRLEEVAKGVLGYAKHKEQVLIVN